MNQILNPLDSMALPNKESTKMRKRPATIATVFAAAGLLMLAVLPTSQAAAAPSPWWHIVTGSHPSNLWEAKDNVQAIQKGSFVTILRVKGTPVACMGTPLCAILGFFDPELAGLVNSETAEELKAALEGPSAYGPGNVAVSEEPPASGRFVITSIGEDAGQSVPSLEAQDILGGAGASAAVLQGGGSGRLVVTVLNVGDAPAKGAESPVVIKDELPEGVIATDVAGEGGVGSPDCALDSETHVTCAFKETLPSYEALEVEVFVSLQGSPPVAGEPGEVTVSGGKAPSETAVQEIEVSPEPVPFGIERFSARTEEERGDPATQAGGHPFQFVTTVQANTGPITGQGSARRVQQPALLRNLRFPLPAGMIGNVTTAPRCSTSDFFRRKLGSANDCPDATAIGVINLTYIEPKALGFARLALPVFNLEPAFGEPARFGFTVNSNPVVIDLALDTDNSYQVEASVNNATQAGDILSSTVVIWGTPGDADHDSARGWGCVYKLVKVGPCERPPSLGEAAFLRQPVACSGPLEFRAEEEPWNVPIGSFVDEATSIADELSGCNQVRFNPEISAAATSKLAANPSGLDFRLDMPNEGLLDPEAIGEGHPKRVEVDLPEGVTINPSQGEGLAGCSLAQYAWETAHSVPGAGCPDASKIGSLQISTPLLEEEARGSLYVANPYDNPFGSLLALYMVARIPERGIVVKQAGVVEPDPKTGQLTTTFDDLPQLPITSFRLHFREGGRAPLVTPSACGTYDVVARFTPWSAADPDNPTPAEIVTKTSSFEIERGVDGGACPGNGTPPFHPGLLAGTINNSAGSYSPFNVRLTRKDGEQEFTNFSIKLPPGVIGKLAGIDVCSDAAIAAAKSRARPNGGLEEINSPSCPSNSQVGRTLVGAGVGGSLTYVPGKLFLAGPFNGAPLSFVSITAARVGPFDLGTVVLRLALKIDPETAEVFVDPTGSDPIPHIIQGIPVHARDIRVYTDRPEFVLNPTNCEPTSTASTVLGSGLNFASAVDDEPVDVTSPFQAADCASLGFKPKLSLKLLGGTKRGDNPKLRAVMKPRSGDANLGKIQVTLPHSEFIEQGHFKTICTRVQFAAGSVPGESCPKNSIYGYARVFTPLLDDPVEGPVFLRSSSHPLPDLVMALHNDQINLNVDARIDSVQGGRLRSTFELLPDAPVTKAVLTMQGGKKGLFVNSTNLCKGKHNVIVNLDGQNGKLYDFKTPLQAQCGGKKSKKSKSRAR